MAASARPMATVREGPASFAGHGRPCRIAEGLSSRQPRRFNDDQRSQIACTKRRRPLGSSWPEMVASISQIKNGPRDAGHFVSEPVKSEFGCGDRI